MLLWQRITMACGSNATRCRIAQKLGESGNRTAIPLLVDWAVYPNGDVHDTVLKALNAIDSDWPNSREARRPLERLALKAFIDNSHDVRVNALSVLQTINRDWLHSETGRIALAAAFILAVKHEVISPPPAGRPRHAFHVLKAIREVGDTSFIPQLRDAHSSGVNIASNPTLCKAIQETLHYLESI